MTEQEKPTGFIERIQALPSPIRIIIFLLIFFGAFMLLFTGVATIYYQNVRALPRIEPITLQEGQATVREFAIFPEEATDVYPSALATAADGTLYIGSYMTGTVYAVDGEGTINELPTTNENIGSIAGMDWSAGVLYILDRLDPVTGSGGIVWAWDGTDLTQSLVLPADGRTPIIAPNDIAVDDAGNRYITDLLSDTVWRFSPTGERTAWWLANIASQNATPAGLAYNPATDSLLITDIGRDAVYSVSITADDTRTATETLYVFDGDSRNPFGLNGIEASSNGRIFVAALDDNRVIEIDGSTGAMTSLAGGFRGSADVAYDPLTNRVFVANWDQRWLQPVTFVIYSTYIDPRLPFSVDAIEFTENN